MAQSTPVLAVGKQQIVAMVSEETRLEEVKLANTMQQADGGKKVVVVKIQLRET